MKNINIKKSFIKLVFTPLIDADNRRCESDVMIRLDRHKPDDFDILANECPVNVTLVCRKLYKLMKGKHFAWILEGDCFYAIVEYSIVGILIKYFHKSQHSINDVYRGLIGRLDEIWINDQFETKLTFAQAVREAEKLKSRFNTDNYNVLKNDCKHFAWKFGTVMDDNFAYSFKNICSFSRIIKQRQSPFVKNVIE